MEIKVMTYNIQSCKDYVNKNFDPFVCLKVIKEFMPDILCLNEVRSESSHPDFTDNTKIIASELGYQYYYFGQTLQLKNGPYGNSIISKYPITSITKIMIEDPLVKDEPVYYESRFIIKAVIKNVTVFAIHVGLAESEQKNAIETLVKLIDETEGQIIVMGDFNMESENEQLLHVKERLVDTSIVFKKPFLTYPSINPTKRIDYIFTNMKIIDSYAIEKVASDHFSVVAILDLIGV